MSNDRKERELFRQVGRCLKTALDNYETRTTPTNYKTLALYDIEVDLEAALEAVRELIRRPC